MVGEYSLACWCTIRVSHRIVPIRRKFRKYTTLTLPPLIFLREPAKRSGVCYPFLSNAVKKKYCTHTTRTNAWVKLCLSWCVYVFVRFFFSTTIAILLSFVAPLGVSFVSFDHPGFTGPSPTANRDNAPYGSLASRLVDEPEVTDRPPRTLSESSIRTARPTLRWLIFLELVGNAKLTAIISLSLSLCLCSLLTEFLW